MAKLFSVGVPAIRMFLPSGAMRGEVVVYNLEIIAADVMSFIIDFRRVE